jgi:hypothetical protein
MELDGTGFGCAHLMVAVLLKRMKLQDLFVDEAPNVLDVKLAALKGEGVPADRSCTRFAVLICKACMVSSWMRRCLSLLLSWHV